MLLDNLYDPKQEVMVAWQMLGKYRTILFYNSMLQSESQESFKGDLFYTWMDPQHCNWLSQSYLHTNFFNISKGASLKKKQPSTANE